MIVDCPGCCQPIMLHPSQQEEGTEVRCGACGGRHRVRLSVRLEPVSESDTAAEKFRGVPAFASASRQESNRVVLVAVDGELTNELIREVVEGSGLTVVSATSGPEALSVIERERPALALLDVGLPQPSGLEVCEAIRKSPYGEGIGVILVASLLGKPWEERNAIAESGADDYLERHRIQQDLPGMLNRVLEARAGAPPSLTGTVGHPASAEPTLETSEVEQPLQAASQAEAVSYLTQRAHLLGDSPSETQAHEAARRLARSIMADLALYNQKAVEEGIRNGTFYELLKEDLEEGRRLFRQQVSPEVLAQRDYYQEAIDELIQKRKATMGLA